MSKQAQLEQEIKAMEAGVYGNPSDAAKADDSTKPTEEVETTEASLDETQDTFEDDLASEENTESDNSTTQEDVDDDVDTSKPTRTNWKKSYMDLDKRFRNLKASNDNTIFNLRKENAAYLQDIESLQTKLNKVNSDMVELKSRFDSDSYSDLLSDEERDIVGEDTLNSFKKLNKAAIESAVKPLKEQLEEERKLREARIKEQVIEQSRLANQTFLSRLGDIVPDYVVYDVDPEFLQWMNGVDTLSLDVRKDLFKRAQTNGDVGRVAQFFLEFKKLKSAERDVLQQKITPTSQASRQVTPTKKASDSNKPKVEYVSMAGIDKFYQDVAKGRYKGKEKLKREIEAKINEAHRTGRLVA